MTTFKLSDSKSSANIHILLKDADKKSNKKSSLITAL